ncbi:MAG: pantetheine-phosphate adenylyltransferase [Clostridia bacterium]|nr:pantetheine-phosphate adenylyltransferase [Clostridia bacterium]
MKRAVYPGTFDPITKGHLDIAQRAAKLVDELIIGVAADTYKHNLFSLDERVALVRAAVAEFANVRVEGFEGLLVDFVRSQGACAIVRGLRAVSDFEYEFQVYLMNKRLSPQIETIFLMTTDNYTFLSSSIVKRVASLGGSVSNLVPPEVESALKLKFRQTS